MFYCSVHCDGCPAHALAIIRYGANVYPPEGWTSLQMKVEGSGYYEGYKKYHFCPECSKKLGIPEDTMRIPEGVADQLVELIYRAASEAAEEVVSNRMGG